MPDAGSTFVGWAGACTGTAPCVVWLGRPSYVAAIFNQVPTSFTTSYYHTDVIGSVRAITDASGAAVIRHDYAAFGEDTLPVTGDPIRFGGKELDPETAMEYFGARSISADMGAVQCRRSHGRESFESADIQPLCVCTEQSRPAHRSDGDDRRRRGRLPDGRFGPSWQHVLPGDQLRNG